jgi:hypothetical protein
VNPILWARRIAMASLICFAPAFSAESPDGGTVQHMSFDVNDQTVYNLRKFNGRYTALLVSQSTLDAMGIAKVRQTIDENDNIYAAFRAFIGADPIGEGLMQISVYENSGCTAACAQNIGWKSLEVRTEFFNSELYPEAIVHEIAHAFDLHGPDIFVNSNGAPGHEWTSFWQHYMMYYLGKSKHGMTATDYLDHQIKKVLQPYEDRAGATWETCIRDGACVTDNPEYTLSEAAQGGAVLRIAQIFGKAVMAKWIPSLKAIIVERGNVVPTTPSGRSELLIESLSRAANTNLSCFFDGWRWPMGSALRGRLSVYAANGHCADNDGDGFSAFKKDCNDASASVRPGAVEAMNGIDDDCDGAVDNSQAQESSPFPEFQENALPVTVPARIVANPPSFSGDVQDWFRFTLTAPELIRFTLDAKQTFQGWIAIRQVNSQNDFSSGFVWRGDIWTDKVSLPAGTWDVGVVVNQDGLPTGNGGEYVLSIRKSYAYPMSTDLTPLTFMPKAATADMGNKYRLPLPAIPASVAGLPGLTAHFWISGFGEVGSIAASSATPFIWTAPSGTNPLGPTYRVKYHSGGGQVHAWSQVQSLLGPAGWASQDIGAVSIPGATSRFGEQNLSVQASGADIWGTSDGFHFAYLPLSGNGEVIAKVHTLGLSNAAVKGGVMIRETLLSNSKNAFIGLQGAAQAAFQYRSATGGNSLNVKRAAAAPLWVKLGRSGDVFTASTSTDGATWTALGSPTTIPMSAALFAGLAVTSHDNSLSTKGGFSDVSVVATNLSISGKVANSAGTGVAGVTVALSGSKSATATTDASGNYVFTGLRQGGGFTATPSRSGMTFTPSNRTFPVLKASATGAFTANPLPAPWVSQDIGSVGVVGSAANVSGTYTVKGSGADIWGTADAFRYVCFPATGDAKLTVRVSAVQNTNAWAKSGIMIRENLTAGSKNAFMAVSAASGVTFQRRTASAGGTTSTLAGGAVPRWLRLTRVGTLFTGFASSDGVTWTQIGSQSITMTANIYVGIAVTSHSNSVLCTSTLTNVSSN